MTTAADDSAVEDAFEAILAGRPVPAGAAGLAAFTGAVRASAARPGRPDAALAELLATGLLTDQSSPSAVTARTAGSPPPRRSSRVRIRRRTAMIFPVLLAKFLSAGAVAQAATGAGVVLVAVTGVGATGALPKPAQEIFATVVATVTPLDSPVPTETNGEGSAPGETLAATVPVTVPEAFEGAEEATAEATEIGEFDVATWALTGPEGHESFTAWVTESAQNGDLKAALRAKGVSFGAVVSGWANGKGVDEDVLEALGATSDAPVAPPAVEADTLEAVEDTAGDEVGTAVDGSGTAVEDSGPRGNGNGAGKAGDGDGAGRGNGKN